VGYSTVSAGHIEIDRFPARARRHLPHYPLPVLRLARLAVDESVRARGVGQSLLRHVFKLALRMALDYGCVGIVVDAKADAVAYYRRFGFETLEAVSGQSGGRPVATEMFLPIRLVAAAAS
jgi:predicted N-acetyltransferase YhbS